MKRPKKSPQGRGSQRFPYAEVRFPSRSWLVGGATRIERREQAMRDFKAPFPDREVVSLGALPLVAHFPRTFGPCENSLRGL